MMTPEELREIREKIGISQAALGLLCGVTGNTVAHYERGELPIPGPFERLVWLMGRHREIYFAAKNLSSSDAPELGDSKDRKETEMLRARDGPGISDSERSRRAASRTAAARTSAADSEDQDRGEKTHLQAKRRGAVHRSTDRTSKRARKKRGKK